MPDVDDTLNTLVSRLEDKYEEGASGFLGGKEPLSFVSTGNIAVDHVIGRPGVPLGRIVEYSGLPESGKSMLCGMCLGSFQRAGGIGVLIDSENSYTKEWVERLGVDWDKLVYFSPQNVEECFKFLDEDIVEQVGDEGIPVCVVIDSFSALPTTTEVDSDFEGRPRSEHARIASFALRKITKKIGDKNVTLIFVGQLKSNPTQHWGQEDEILGGRAVKFHASLRIRLKKMKALANKDRHEGMLVEVKAIKNKTGGVPHRSMLVPFMWDTGVDPDLGFFYLGKELGVVREPSKGWYEVDGYHKKFRESEWEEVLEDNDNVRSKIAEAAFPGQEDRYLDIG